VLVAKKPMAISSLRGKRVAVAALNTTGGTLARMYCPPDAHFITLPYDTIADSILHGEVDAGVMIHEELVHYPKLGLHRVEDLGAMWTQETGLPLPVGLSIIKKSLGGSTAIEIARTCRDSLEWALEHSAEAMKHVGSLGRGCADTFVPMFSNNDTLCMPEDVRRSLRLLFDRLALLGWAPTLDVIEVIDA
jgi:1,4-dihydroxy-6-naphthoate synthase